MPQVPNIWIGGLIHHITLDRGIPQSNYIWSSPITIKLLVSFLMDTKHVHLMSKLENNILEGFWTCSMLSKLLFIHLIATYLLVFIHCAFSTSEKVPSPFFANIRYSSITKNQPMQKNEKLIITFIWNNNFKYCRLLC